MSQTARRVQETIARIKAQEGVEESIALRQGVDAPDASAESAAALNEAAAPPKLKLQPLNTNVSLREQAYAALKQAIMDADIYAHREEIRLDERQLSQALGVSRTPIREAMSLLEQEGFLRTVPRRGVFIVRKTKKQIIEMIEMWAALESMAARLATINASDEDIAALRHMFDEFLSTAPTEHINEYSDANIAFHQSIIRLSGSHLMGQTIDNLFIHVRAIRRLTISQSDRAARSIIDHMQIIEALERRDTELAERLVRDHSLNLARYVEQYCDYLD
jgi:DNA-binding GntR family transcriptional regulator